MSWISCTVSSMSWLSCTDKFDELGKLRMTSLGWMSWTVSWMTWII